MLRGYCAGLRLKTPFSDKFVPFGPIFVTARRFTKLTHCPKLDTRNSITLHADSLRHIIDCLGFGARNSPCLSDCGVKTGGPALSG